MGDGMLHISLMGGQARALLIEGTQMVEKARALHGLSRTAAAALGRTLMAASMLGTMQKGALESVTVSIKGGGPIGTVLAVARSDGSVKGYVENPGVELPRAGEKLPVGAAVGKNGKLTVVKDLGLKEPYVGQVNLASGEIAEDFATYFTASEQVPSLVALGVLVGDRVEAAGGLIVQLMPGAGESAVRSLETSAGMFADISATIGEYHLTGAVRQLLGHLEPEVLKEIRPAYRCDCSKERVERALISIGREELDDMIRERHGAEVNCHFCDRRYRFTEEELKALLEYALNRRSE
ncbi:MAG: Hsp33 family molecular chaperone HslO [Clostridiales bacterium]|nr:Hsp33 family molecular chaperone HslO [Clostridiales bacterium]